MTSPTWQFIRKKPSYFFAFGFGSGLSPIMPGTAGTLVAYPFYFLLSQLLGSWLLIPIVIGYIVGIKICNLASHALNVTDHPAIVWDEIIAMLLVLYFLPQDTRNFYGYIGSFFLFRVFDIVKPIPINLIDRYIKNGHGIMLDDLVAGIYTILVLYATCHFLI